MSYDMEDLQAAAIKGFVVLLFLPITLLTEAHTFRCMWAWFVVPLGLPAIGLSHSLGLATLAIIPFVAHMTVAAMKGESAPWYYVIVLEVGLLLVLLMGYILQLCM